MIKQKTKFKFYILVIPFLIFNQLLLNVFPRNHLLAKTNQSEMRDTEDQAIDPNLLKEEIINKKLENYNNFNKSENDLVEKKDNLKDLKKDKKQAENFEDYIHEKENKKENSWKIVEENNIENPNAWKIVEDNINESSNQVKKTSLPIPKRGKISAGQFIIPARGYVKLKDEKISIDLLDSDPIVALKLIAELGDYGIVVIENDTTQENNTTQSNKKLITVNFNEVNISDAFNSILMASNLQAKIEKNIIFIGEDILNKSLRPDISKTYRINQANAASVADYLSTLGARISKVYVKGSSNDGSETTDTFKQADLESSLIKSYVNEGGPLNGLIGTVDLRLQTITLVGKEDLIKTSEVYIKALDRRHRQVALSIKIIDVSLTNSDIKNNIFESRIGDSYLINNGGFSLMTSNGDLYLPPTGSSVSNRVDGGIAEGKFINWIEAKITNDQAKIMASPTLILGENNDPNISGAATVDDSLAQATIGRPFSNEGFIKVGETVITKFSKTTTDSGVTTCTGTEGTSGITFGAKVDKIDDNGFVTFSLSPAISSVTKTVEISGCGIQSTLSVRKLDTGSIRVKNDNTLVLTGVIKDEDSVATSKVPILGDIPIIGSLFRSSSDVKRKSELIIMVTPKILKDDFSESINL